MTSMHTVTAVIPTLDEAANLPHVLPHLPDLVTEVLIVDGHSTDDTVAVARRLRPDVRIVEQTGKGKGNALASGFAASTGDIIVMLDADGSTDPREIPRFVEALEAGADLVKGSRYMPEGGSEDLTHLRNLGNAALTHMVDGLFHVDYTDLCYGYMAFWRRCLPDLRVDCDGFEVETLITVRAAHAKLHVIEVPSVELPRVEGESHLHPVHDGTRVLHTILRERLSFHHARGEVPVWAAVAGTLVADPAPAR